MPPFTVHAVLALVLCVLYGFATTALALARDVRHPRLDWVNEQEAIKQSSGVLIGLLISWGILVTLGILSYFLLSMGLNMYLYTAAVAAILAVVCWLAYRHLIRTAHKMTTEEA